MPFKQTEAEAKADFETCIDVVVNQNTRTLNSSPIDQSTSNTSGNTTSGQVQYDLPQYLGDGENASPVSRSVTGGNAICFRSATLGYADTDVSIFDDVAQARTQWDNLSIEKISEIRIQHGRWIHHIALTYKLISGAMFRTNHGRLFPVEDGLANETIDISDTEQVVGISGRASLYMIHEIEFHIENTRNGAVRTVGPFGNERCSPWIAVEEYGAFFNCKGEIVAFAGTLSNKFDSTLMSGLSFICRGSPPEFEVEDASFSLFRGTLLGCTDSKSGAFDDVVHAATGRGSSRTPKISAITVQHGRWVHHLAVTYKLGNGAKYRTVHGPLFPLEDGLANETINLSDSDQIVAISGRASSYMIHEIEFHIQNTQNGVVRTVGPFGNEQCSPRIAVKEYGAFFLCKGEIVAFAGTLSNKFDSTLMSGLSFICRGSPPELEVEDASCSLFRGTLLGCTDSNSGTFDDVVHVAREWGSSKTPKISAITVQHGRWVHHLTVTYKLSNGAKYRTAHGHLFPHLRDGFANETIDLSESDQIVAISGRASSYMIHEIEFHIQNTRNGTVRTVGPFGNERAAPHIDVEEYGNVFHCKGNIVSFAGTLSSVSRITAMSGLSFITQGSAPKISMQITANSINLRNYATGMAARVSNGVAAVLNFLG